MKFNSPEEASAPREMMAGAAMAPMPSADALRSVRRLTGLLMVILSVSLIYPAPGSARVGRAFDVIRPAPRKLIAPVIAAARGIDTLRQNDDWPGAADMGLAATVILPAFACQARPSVNESILLRLT